LQGASSLAETDTHQAAKPRRPKHENASDDRRNYECGGDEYSQQDVDE
jgi:hypothetical protein